MAPVRTLAPQMTARISALLVLVALLPALVVLTPLAYASPPDPAWISGFFDDGDHDDVVVLVTSVGATLEPFPLRFECPALPPAGRLWRIEVPAGDGQPLSRSTPRAPPAV